MKFHTNSTPGDINFFDIPDITFGGLLICVENSVFYYISLRYYLTLLKQVSITKFIVLLFKFQYCHVMYVFIIIDMVFVLLVTILMIYGAVYSSKL